MSEGVTSILKRSIAGRAGLSYGPRRVGDVDLFFQDCLRRVGAGPLPRSISLDAPLDQS
jgi:hypothetical protein